MKIIFFSFYCNNFFGELTLDSSICFVRSGYEQVVTDAPCEDRGNSDSTGKKAPVRLVVECGAHSALPAYHEETLVRFFERSLFFSKDILIPNLKKIPSRIDRPPIS